MKIKIQQFLFGKLHSWSLCGQQIGRALLKQGHEIHFISTDGLNEKYIPTDLKPHIRINPDKSYHANISYTAPNNWKSYLNNASGKRLAIWNYEYRGSNLLPGTAKNYLHVDRILPSSEFSKQVFLDMGIPEEKLTVVPHGINLEDFENKNKYPLKTNKKYKILLNIASPHKRKAIHLALESYGKAFNKKDDVCLVIKVHTANKKEVNKECPFDVDFYELYNDFIKKYPNRGEVEIITDYIPNIVELLNNCNIHLSTSFCECFLLPAIEALAANLINVVPNYGGQLDFCNTSNSLLINGKICRAPKDHQYWSYSPYAQHYMIDTNDAAEKLRLAVSKYDKLRNEFLSDMKKQTQKYTWDNVAKQILEL